MELDIASRWYYRVTSAPFRQYSASYCIFLPLYLSIYIYDVDFIEILDSTGYNYTMTTDNRGATKKKRTLRYIEEETQTDRYSTNETIVIVFYTLLSIGHTNGITHLFSIPTRQWLTIQFIGVWSNFLFFHVQQLHFQLLLRMLFPKICQSSLPLPICFRLHIYSFVYVFQ